MTDIKGQQPGTALGSSKDRAIDTTPKADDLWSCAVEMFQAGHRRRATEICEQILVNDPGHPDALHLKGAILIATSDSTKGIELIEKSISLAPDRASFRENLAEILIAKGEHEKAIAHLRTCCQIDPVSAEAHTALGAALARTGDSETALSSLFQALSLRLNHSRTWFWVGVALFKQERYEEAVTALRAAISVPAEQPEDHTDAWFQLGRVLFELQDFEGSKHAYEEVIARKPKSVEALHNLGDVLIRTGYLTGAVEAFQNALTVQPGEVSCLLGLAMAYMRQARFDRCTEICVEALNNNPDPGNEAEARTCLGIIFLLRGDWEKGWPLYESRRDDEKHRERRNTIVAPEWTGETLQGKTLFVYPEQGYGDIIQFSRYLPLLADRGARVYFEAPDCLVSLLRENDLKATILTPTDPRPKYDLFTPLGSLPYRFATTIETIPQPDPYLRSHGEKAAKYRDLMAQDVCRLRVGIAWQGNPRHRLDSIRSAQLADFLCLCQLEGVRLFSLQKGHGIEQLQDIPDESSLVDLGSSFQDYSDTAGAIANLDLVISVDTSVAHLAAAMGKPVWILSATVPDWRWLLGRNDSPWYSSVRLFRQERRDDWAHVFEQIVIELGGLLRTRVRPPTSQYTVAGLTPRSPI